MTVATWDDDNMIWRKFSDVVAETGAAYFLTIENENICLPKSQIKVDWPSSIIGIPRWLAKQKGLVKTRSQENASKRF